MLRWERQKQIFEILDNTNQLTVRELSDMLGIELQLSDNLLRHYNKNGYLTRSKNFFDKFSYQLSDKGINQLRGFLENKLYLKYQDITVY